MLYSRAVAGKGTADRDDQAAVRVDDNLMVGGVPVILGLFSHLVVAGGYQGSVHDEHGVFAEPYAGLECEQRAEVVDDAVG